MPDERIGIIGAGAWGSALAQLWARDGRDVTLWMRDAVKAATMHQTRAMPALPGLLLHAGVRVTDDYAQIDACDIVVYALPAQVMRTHLSAHPVRAQQTLVIAAKGIEITTGMLLPFAAYSVCPGSRVAVLSGPNIAAEIAQGLPAASTVACDDPDTLAHIQSRLATKYFRLYPTTDIVGAACGGAIKNVIIMASGIVDGMGLGENARAAVLTRGLAEMVRLAVALGGQRETLMGLSGIGDLFLKTRNYRFGTLLASGDAFAFQEQTTIEGVHTARAVTVLAAQNDIDMPICAAVAACLNGQLSVQQAAEMLMQRPSRKDERE